MDPLVLTSLIVFAVAIALGLAAASWQGLGVWRAVRDLRGVIEPALLETETRLAGLESRSAKISDSTERLERARSQLEQSLATLNVLLTGAREVTAKIRRLRSLVPSK